MRFISLFTGIGGIDLGLERAGMTCVAQVENDPYCNKILNKHWPDVPKYGDIHNVKELPHADLIAGGFPCQPVSLAGKRKGTDDDRWLWPQFARIIRLVRPEYVLVENVPGLLTAGFGQIASDLAHSGYDTEWTRLSAQAVGAPHLRQRIFLIAYSERSQLRNQPGRRNGQSGPDTPEPRDNGQKEPVADADSGRREGSELPVRQPRQNEAAALPSGTRSALADADHKRSTARRAEPSRSWLSGGGGSQGGSSHWSVEPDVDRVAHGIPRRVDRLRGLGNAVVPQVAQHIGELIMTNWQYT